MDWGIRCVQLLVKLCLRTKKRERWKKKRGRKKLFNEGDTRGGFFCLSLPLALMGLLPSLGWRPKRMPCAPQMGLLNMKGHHVQMVHLWLSAIFSDKCEIQLMNIILKNKGCWSVLWRRTVVSGFMKLQLRKNTSTDAWIKKTNEYVLEYKI